MFVKGARQDCVVWTILHREFVEITAYRVFSELREVSGTVDVPLRRCRVTVSHRVRERWRRYLQLQCACYARAAAAPAETTYPPT